MQVLCHFADRVGCLKEVVLGEGVSDLYYFVKLQAGFAHLIVSV